MKMKGAGIGLVVLVISCGGGRSIADTIELVGPAESRGALEVTPALFHSLDGRNRVEAESGRLRVPMNRAAGKADSISVHYVRFPATAESDRSPIVYLAGGPGGSGTASAAGDRYDLFQSLREVADVIAYDQRGTWNADPYMVCPGSWSFPLDTRLTEDALAEAIAPWVTECHRSWTEQGIDLDGYNTVESAADLEALRIALGVETLDLWAISYGTHLALEFARSYPASVGRMVLAGTEGLDHTLKSPAMIEAVLERTDQYFAETGREPVTQRARTVIQALEEDPVTVPVTDENGEEVQLAISAMDARRAIFGSAGERGDFEDLNAGLGAAATGDYAPAAQGIQNWRDGGRGLAMSLAMDCSSWVSDARMEQLDAEAAASYLGNASDLLLRAQCRSWPGQRLGPAFHSPVSSDIPTLFISGALDVRTPVEQAMDVARGFRNAWHLVIRDGGHDDDLLIATPLVAEHIKAFLRGEIPERDRIEIEIGG